jgi:hypothetical protein
MSCDRPVCSDWLWAGLPGFHFWQVRDISLYHQCVWTGMELISPPLMGIGVLSTEVKEPKC